MQLQTKMSPFVFIIPFAVMLVVIGVAMFAAGNGTDLRSHASNSKEKQCATACTKLGGNVAACTNVCPKVIDGSMTCAAAAEAIGVHSPLFLSACEKISPLREKTCDQICAKAGTGFSDGAGAVKAVCKKVCADVSTGAKNCSQACTDNLPQTAAGKMYMGACTKMCATIPVKTGTPTPTVSGSTPTPTASGSTPTPTASQASCATKCVAPSGLSQENAVLYKTRCMSICQDISSGAKTCAQGCGTIGNQTWKTRCMTVLCPAN